MRLEEHSLDHSVAGSFSAMDHTVMIDTLRTQYYATDTSSSSSSSASHATTLNAHGPAAFTRMRCRLASRREMILRGTVATVAHASRFHCEPGADGLRADHFYFTRSRGDWRGAAVQEYTPVFLVVRSAATRSDDAIGPLKAP